MVGSGQNHPIPACKTTMFGKGGLHFLCLGEVGRKPQNHSLHVWKTTCLLTALNMCSVLWCGCRATKVSQHEHGDNIFAENGFHYLIFCEVGGAARSIQRKYWKHHFSRQVFEFLTFSRPGRSSQNHSGPVWKTTFLCRAINSVGVSVSEAGGPKTF